MAKRKDTRVVYEKKNLPIDQLRVASDKYQRTHSDSRVKKMIKNFDPLSLGVLLVGRRSNGTYWIVDGNHRKEALEAMGRTTAPCLVFNSSGVKEEARVWRIVNGSRRGTTALQDFRAALEEGNPYAIQLNDVVTEHGFEVATKSSKQFAQRPYIKAIGALKDIVRMGGFELLDQTLGTLNRGWPFEDDAIRGEIMGGVSRVLHVVDGLDIERLISTMEHNSPKKIVTLGDPLRLAASKWSDAIAEALVRVYNKGLRKKKAYNPR